MTSVVLDRSDPNSIETVASEICNATFGKWRVCEVWREDKRVAIAAREADATTTTTTSLSLAFGAGPKRDCFSPMRAPRSHACARCLDQPIAKMLRTACALTFSPGIGLVGRAWLLGRAEIVDLASGQWPATYARPAAAEQARMATVIAVPLVLDDGVRVPTAVVVVTFGVRLAVPGVRPGRTLAEDLLDAMLARGRAAAEKLRAPPRLVISPPKRPVTPPKLADADREYAKKLARGPGDKVCPVCHGPIERGVRIRACRHAACAECLARWALTSSACPVCRSEADEVIRDPTLDAEPSIPARTVSL